MRRAQGALALLIAVSALLPGVALGAAPPPKVVVIVGPVGEATGRYLARGEAAAREAERFTPNVVRVFTPDATWPAVKRAIQGASMVVYLGHGNGWPSQYRNALYPPTQNGFGLNPVAGAGNDAHEYFGEERIAADVKLAKNAVVLLHHLCYASGNTEPGLAEGTEDEARQRVDNYAAGFIAAGAAAVIAEGHQPPAWYVRSILSGKRSIERTWRSSPSANGNTFTFASTRSPGFSAAMDPDRPGHGFYRSLVVRSGLLPADVAAGATLTSVADAGPAEPTLAGSGLTLAAPYLKGRLLAGNEATLWIPYSMPDGAKRPQLTVGVRWDPIDVAAEPPDSGPTEPPTPPGAAEAPGASPEPSPSDTPSPTPSSEVPAGAPQPTELDDPADARLSLVEPERLGSVVEPVAVGGGPTRIIAPITLPQRPGRYRLVATLHDATGVAYDAATQALLSGVLVQVGGDLGARYLVSPTANVTAGAEFELRAGIANVGSTAWGHERLEIRPRHVDDAEQATLVAHWVALAPSGDGDALPPDIRLGLPAGLEFGQTARVTLAGTAPTTAGHYLLVLDVIDPELGSLTALGIEPGLVRVTVEAATS
jgi:hypothetical protein